MKNSNGKSAIKYMVLFGLLLIANGAWAKDLFVAPNGNDSVSYASNSITSPWATVSKAFASALAGDTVNFRAGTYNIASTISTTRGGSAGSPITFKNYNNELVIWTSPVTTVFYINHPYIYIEGIICDGLGTGGASFFNVGYNGTAPNFKASHLTAQNLGTAPDNAGFIYLAGSSNNSIVEYCTISGHSKSDNANVSGIIAFVSTGIKIRNNHIYNFPNGIYYKHPNPVAESGIEIYGNYVHDCSLAIQSVTNYANYHDNIIVGNVAVGYNSGGNYDGGNYNTFQHNTFYNSSWFTFVNDWPSRYNIVKDNIFTGGCHWHEYTSGYIPHYTTSDYNLFRSSSYAVKENGVQYSLSTWKSHTGGDAHSLSGSPTFVGGSTPSTIAGYALATGSLGKGAASDGKDMGADVSLVGVNTSGSTSTITPMAQTAPANPIGLTVQ